MTADSSTLRTMEELEYDGGASKPAVLTGVAQYPAKAAMPAVSAEPLRSCSGGKLLERWRIGPCSRCSVGDVRNGAASLERRRAESGLECSLCDDG